MEFVPYRDLRNQPLKLRQKLQDQGELVVTVDGKPFAVMIDLTGSDDLEDLLLMITRLRAQMAARAIRSHARSEQLDQLDDENIDELIQKTRTERKY